MREKKASKVCVETLVARDELVGEGQAGHETAFFEPEDRGKGAAEEDAFDCCKGHEAAGEGGVLILDPFDGPVGFLTDAGNCDASMISSSRDVEGPDWYQWHGRDTGVVSVL